MRVSFSTAQLSRSPSSPPSPSCQHALPTVHSTERLLGSLVSSRAVSSPSTSLQSSPNLVLSLHLHGSSYSRFGHLPARALSSHAAVARRTIPHPHHPKPFSRWFARYIQLPRPPGIVVVGRYVGPSPRPSHSPIDLMIAQVVSASLGGRVGARDDGGDVRTQTPSSHRRVATGSS